MHENSYKDLLHNVEKPSRYSGNEWNVVKKDLEKIDLSICLAFPDIYEVAMSHLGFKILYHIINSRDEFAAERVNAPWTDFEKILREKNMPLRSLESQLELNKFDLVGFTLQYEMSYTNILNMLDLGHIPVLSQDRGEDAPLVIAGGPCAFNPEPLHNIIDAFVIGEGEEAILELLDTVKKGKKQGLKRDELLRELTKIQGVYVPKYYQGKYDENGVYKGTFPTDEGIPKTITKRFIRDMSQSSFPQDMMVPYMDIVHDRIMLEICRGCSRGCRFCQAGMLYRPVREKNLETLLEQAEKLVKSTGYGEISLSSLSSADHSQIHDLAKGLVDTYKDKGVGVSLPSLRVDSFSIELAEMVQQVRKTGLTFAPEAGSQRLRDVINKNVTEENLINAVSDAFKSGWNRVKLYFMIGLPTETYEDLDGIVDLAEKVVAEYKKHGKNMKRFSVTVSTSSFVPKPHTPFQWVPQFSKEELVNRQNYLKSKLKSRYINYSWHDVEVSYLEAIFAKGDRKLADVLYTAWKKGCKMDGWGEHFKYDIWLDSFKELEVNPDNYAYATPQADNPLPWDHISSGVNKKYMALEYKRALKEEITEDCSFGACGGCGACNNLKYDVKKVRRGQDA
ncbi:TIGR03960 family B12-binding radical SAM protein [Alkalicella caledoniensis]|uniref:TIGR03960 family B12-binding radical SAM protein n=1 Tax=Alkalicella caledoniensis TaxID=2731377 RepID=A0A7G9W4I8_ALKCA|nr:TIGR03960 family B12-binding radical SAM protein [Alkalicella caledoniensis]QNO13600.1 TIGR03960 family B12-binding radical SAM protein [Alkalicella caledoniensis]